MLKSKGVLIGAAVAIVAGTLAIASMTITTTSGAGTDEDDTDPTPVATATTAPSTPPQAPIEPPADPNAGDLAGAGSGPGGLPNAGFGTSGTDSDVSLWVMLGFAGAALAAGTGMMAAARNRK